MKFRNITLGVLALVVASNVTLAAPVKNNVTDKSVAEINLLLEKNDYKLADKKILEAGNDVQYKILSAISLTMQDKLDAAQDILDAVKPSALTVSDYYYAQAAIYLKRIDTSDMRYRTKRDELINLAINQLNYSLKLNPNNARAYNALGVADLKKEDYFKVVEILRRKYAETILHSWPSH